MLAIAVVAYVLTNALADARTNRIIWIVAAVLVVLVAFNAFVPGVWRT
jgi:hypothetical protein